MKTSYSKKRKYENPLDDIERTLHSSFSTAANRITHLYTQSVSQQRKAYKLGARHMADKILQWLETEHGTSAPISPVSLLAFLRQELEDIDCELPVDLGTNVAAGQASAVPTGPPGRSGRADGRSSPQQENRRVRYNPREARAPGSTLFDPAGPSQPFNIQQQAQLSQDQSLPLQHGNLFGANPNLDNMQGDSMQEQPFAPGLDLGQQPPPQLPMAPMEAMDQNVIMRAPGDQNMAVDIYRCQ
mmetsp:Transcript_21135/g.25435  ORF Transcript_21135/g.25435 Transcript_21135/m.25435 type:complete len:243 (-) Transcript_21135:357-1085(-)|eukprot:CAMPEP_0197851244 /NCGR_PEP_ID=MMETSP1438-20131217/17635_1 /TAXON_ID=1461541 /ORGANISM="Pterosperma sp., Strain CCMP1384" /LENGTH=242 /DNA_ID=CAMNT_0043464783 /DNA_START=316 /DNA_END=1044 /DNA_ORIENTATION=+